MSRNDDSPGVGVQNQWRSKVVVCLQGLKIILTFHLGALGFIGAQKRQLGMRGQDGSGWVSPVKEGLAAWAGNKGLGGTSATVRTQG